MSTKVGISIDVIEPVSAMKSIQLSPNLAAIRMQRLPAKVTAHKRGITSFLVRICWSLREMLALCF